VPTKAKLCFEEFLGIVGAGQYRPQRKFLRDILLGLIVARSPILSRISLAMDPDNLETMLKRLSRNLRTNRMDDAALSDRALDLATSLARPRSKVVAIDGGDISKKYARKMPKLAWVHDGSAQDGEPALRRGWSLVRAEAVVNSGSHIPLDQKLYSTVDESFRSVRATTEDFLKRIVERMPATTLYVADSGYDGENFRVMFNELGVDYMVRLVIAGSKGKRFVACADDDPVRLLDLAQGLEPLGRARFVRGGKPQNCELAATSIRFTDRDTGALNIVVLRREGKVVLVIATTRPVTSVFEAKAAISTYMSRWAVEGAFREVKTSLGVEDVRLLRWRGITRIAFLVFIVQLFSTWMVYRRHGVAVARSAPATGPLPRRGLLERVLRGIAHALWWNFDLSEIAV